MFTRICGMVLVCALLIGCMKRTAPPPVPPTPSDPLITALTIGVAALPGFGGSAIAAANSLYADKKITKKERDEVKAWTLNLSEASANALVVLKSSDSRAVKLVYVSKVINDALMANILKTMSPEVKAAYIVLTGALEAIAVQLKVAN